MKDGFCVNERNSESFYTCFTNIYCPDSTFMASVTAEVSELDNKRLVLCEL
jgi:hypothetical protein